MRYPEEAERMGALGREVVREKFLSTSNLRNYLRLFTDLATTQRVERHGEAAS